MANQATTNLFGTLASDSTVANLITIATTKYVEISINGTSGAARVAKNTTTPNLTTDSVLMAGAGYRLIVAEPGGPPITTLLLYANQSESTLTYAVNIIERGVVVGA